MRKQVKISVGGHLTEEEVVSLYRDNGWSSADKPKTLLDALRHSHTLVTARIGEELVGLGNAISDGYLVVYYPHLLVKTAYQGQGIGRLIMQEMHNKYAGFHQQMLTADSKVVGFYESRGFKRAGSTVPMWIYQGSEH
ncbi:MAG: GNAT family N-acetyltransferase [Chromatiaceae bacterium]|nr:GNAT family N-acetyltransferase [Chromatiaceae bacterium]